MQGQTQGPGASLAYAGPKEEPKIEGEGKWLQVFHIFLTPNIRSEQIAQQFEQF